MKLHTSRLALSPFSPADFELFVNAMLTDPRVVEFYWSYRELNDPALIRDKATRDFWEHFEESRNDHGLEVWAARTLDESAEFVGWCGLLHTALSDRYHGPELQYMIAGNAQGKGYATELAHAAVGYAEKQLGLQTVIATVDIPNTASIKVLQKAGLERVGEIEAYGSDEMYLYRISFHPDAEAAGRKR